MDKNEVKLEIDSRILDRAKEYNINLEECLSSAILKQVNEIKEKRKHEEFIKKLTEQHDEETIIKIIKRIIRTSKFDYASKSNIIAEAEQEFVFKEDIR